MLKWNLTYSLLEQKLLCCTFCDDDKAICAGTKGDVHCVDMETMTDVFPAGQNAGSRVMDIMSFSQSKNLYSKWLYTWNSPA